MTRPACAVFLLSAGLCAAGCGSYDVTTSRPDRPADSASDEAAKPTSESPPPSSPAAPPLASRSGDQRSGVSPTEQRVESRAAGPPTPSQRAPLAPSTPAQPAPPPRASRPTVPEQPPIRLSAGVALPQTLPTGTAVGFSIDYKFTQGEPNQSLRYVWVIEPAKGQPVRQQVRLEREGTLQGFVTHFRPENGPFSTHIEDYRGNRLSPSVPLR